MPSTPLASSQDVEARLRRDLSDQESEWIDAVLEEASLLVTAYCGRTFDEPVPDVVRVVTSRVAARGVTTAAPTGNGLDQLPVKVGPVEWAAPSPDAAAGGGWLTRWDKQMLRRWVGKGHVTSVYTA